MVLAQLALVAYQGLTTAQLDLLLILSPDL